MMRPTFRAPRRRPWNWITGLVVGALLVTVVGPYVYINVIRGAAPDRLTFDDAAEAAEAAEAATGDSDAAFELDGQWTVVERSQAGYRVGEVLFGQDAEAVGRTTEVTGTLAADGMTVDAAGFVVDMSTVESDESRRDSQFHGRIMDTATHPTATFELTEPITLESLPADGEEVTVAATGDLTVRGVTRAVTFELVARRNGATLEVNGSIPVEFADFEIPDASFGPATVEDHGEIEFLLVFARGSRT